MSKSMASIDQLSPDFVAAYAEWLGVTEGEAYHLLKNEPLRDVTDEVTAAGWEEAEHPRHPEGDEHGGEFATAGIDSEQIAGLSDELARRWPDTLGAGDFMPRDRYEQATVDQLRKDLSTWDHSTWEQRVSQENAPWARRLSLFKDTWRAAPDNVLLRGFNGDPGWKQGDVVRLPLSDFTTDAETAQGYGDMTLELRSERAFPTQALEDDPTPMSRWVAGGRMKVLSRTPDRIVLVMDEEPLRAAGWDESRHPRHPSGSERGGEFAPKEAADRLNEQEGISAAGWDESEHPRHPEGDERGGQFRSKEGSDERTPPSEQLGSGRDPNWTGPTVGPQRVSWGGHIFDPLQHSDAIWNGYRIPYMQANMDTDELREAWRLNDMNPTEYQQAISEQFAADVADAPVMIRTPATRVEDILADGRFKSQHETIGSEGAYSPEVRRVQENMFFGYDDSTPAEQRPIYGYVDNGNQGVAAAEQYGDVRWELRPGTWSRTTVSDADSLSRPLVPGPKANPGWRAALPAGYSDMGMGGGFGGQQHDQLTWGFGNEDYIEAQVHGGVSLDDVKAVWLPEDWEGQEEAWVPDRYGYSRRINVPELVEKLSSRGIEVGYGE